ncbi:UNVERIFIED_CONTAM: hypothetical protein K2H54_059183 [Gekko kuhli]
MVASLVFFKLKIKKAINFRHQSSISEKLKDPLLGKTSSGPETLSVAMMERPGLLKLEDFNYTCMYAKQNVKDILKTFLKVK